ncbi:MULTISPECIES: FAD-dependent oxidoreductase [unclassified Massilia]|uniref:FAD-dependent oxidoreductase n=1 Tax=unclassified Massilia TaxID=2609279 RepID=UPI0017809C54|nr:MULTISPECIES: FAD-dependent oxidoreductase [unclassified Massilia]MBD8529941.1 FAD-dependent oxidoreductase [Massilia sp. CFBP 13647]MBD8673862.1 FAD-dependent oxidoreductase [Massilia sp. CFBP 13721]
MDKSARIAIIGAGVSGIFTAIELKKRGYANVVLYEQAGHVASLTASFAHDGHQFDLSTKVIPAVGLAHAGVYPPLKALIEEAGLTLRSFPEPVFHDFTRRRAMKVPHFMRAFGKLRILREFARACELLLAIRRSPFTDGAWQTDLLRPGETVAEWAARHDVQSFGVFTKYLVDLFNQGPAHTLPAGVVLMSRMHFAAPFLHALLTRPGLRQFLKWTRRGNAELAAFLDLAPAASSYVTIEEGYGALFPRLVAHYGLRVEYGSLVSDLRKTVQGLTLTVNGASTHCDALIFCCPPPAIAALSYLPDPRRVFGALRLERTIRTWAFEVEQWDERRFGKQAIVIDGENRLCFATSAMLVNGELNYVAKEFADSDLICSAVYLDPATSEAQRIEALRSSLRRFHLQLRRVVSWRDFAWPYNFTTGQHSAGDVAQVQQYQGRDGIYYSGEHCFGVGVPTILEYAGKFVASHFPTNALPR